jgi:hypothetical protein
MLRQSICGVVASVWGGSLMKRHLKAVLLGFAAGGLLLVWVQQTLARPGAGRGLHCAACHKQGRDAVELTEYDALYEAGNGSSGTWKAFVTEPGLPVAISIDVINGDEDYALAVFGAVDDFFSPDENWYEVGDAYTSVRPGRSVDWKGDVRRWTFQMDVAEGAAPGLYPFELTVAGKGDGLWFSRERFYIDVKWCEIPEPSTWLLALGASLAAVPLFGNRRSVDRGGRSRWLRKLDQ